MNLIGGSNNEPIVGAMHVKFIARSGVKPLCKIYK